MKRSEYKVFKQMVNDADVNNSIWWCGYYWIDLTDKQLSDIASTEGVIKNSMITIDLKEHETRYTLPSGITLKIRN